jgi:hypothetical protein
MYSDRVICSQLGSPLVAVGGVVDAAGQCWALSIIARTDLHRDRKPRELAGLSLL